MRRTDSTGQRFSISTQQQVETGDASARLILPRRPRYYSMARMAVIGLGATHHARENKPPRPMPCDMLRCASKAVSLIWFRAVNGAVAIHGGMMRDA
jgi:hypothetical protein